MYGAGTVSVEFSAGSVLGRAFGIFGKNFLPFLFLVAVIESPLWLYTWVAVEGDGLSPYYSAVVGIAQFVLGSIATGVVTYGVFQQLRGTPASMGQCIAVGLKRLLSVLGVAFLAGLAMVGGFIALVIPGFIILCMLWVAVPVAIVEGVGGTTALGRSRDLTAGHRWSIFGIIILIGLLNWATQWVLQKIFLTEPTMSAIRTFLFVNLAVSVVFSALSAVAGAVAYHDLRVAKEGVQTEDLARVFD